MMKSFVLALCSLAVAFGAVEVVLRTTHAFNARVSWTEKDALIGWRFTPGREYWCWEENDHPVSGRINALGWRDYERTRAKPAGVRRVAVLGDSYVEAFQVELDSTLAAVAERAAGARGGGSYQFMSFGRSGMSAAEERIVLERDVLPCAPDVVVLLFTPHNDIADASPVTAPHRLRPFFAIHHDSLVLDTSFRTSRAFRFREFLNPLKQHSALISLVVDRVNAKRASDNPRVDVPDMVGPTERFTRMHTLMTAHPDSQYAANYALHKRIVADMARMCAQRGVVFALMSVPAVYQDERVEQLRAVDATFDPSFFERDFSAMADSSDFMVIPLFDRFAERSRATGERLHWAHWNYHGHRVAGTALTGAVAGPAAGPGEAP
ncbi:MAG TPA: SGNH/GDSL hydrolase family protein [Candidatus Krumholzibacteria bacterium]|nr:SGNH/GDSL hydrolase family protein [Candidatus Krumholzibacteria bacterium]